MSLLLDTLWLGHLVLESAENALLLDLVPLVGTGLQGGGLATLVK